MPVVNSLKSKIIKAVYCIMPFPSMLFYMKSGVIVKF